MTKLYRTKVLVGMKAIWYFKRKYWKRHRREARRRAWNEARLRE
jgi:hypothetical protein